MQLAWSNLTPFEKTAVVVAGFELVLFIAVVAVPAAVAGYGYMLYWLIFGPPSLCFAPLLFRWFKYQEERPLVQPITPSGNPAFNSRDTLRPNPSLNPRPATASVARREAPWVILRLAAGNTCLRGRG